MKYLILLLSVPAILLAGEIYSLMNFKPVSEEQAELFSRLGFDVVQVYRDGSVDLVANSTDRRTLLENGLVAETRISDMEGFYRARNGSTDSMGGFYTWSEIDAWIDSLASANPSITSVQSIGDTYQGRPQRVMKISVNNSFDDDDPSMANAWYDGLIHAREGGAMRNIRYWMMWLCSNYQRNGYCGYQATWLLNNREIWCLPCNNVDGWVRNEVTNPSGGGMRRKNMNLTAGGGLDNGGIDLNRNWAVHWGGPGSSGSPSSQTYRGTGPLSEPESSNIDQFWQNHPPAQMHSTHTYSNVLIYPWGWTDQPTTHSAAYTASGEMMVQWATGEEHYPSWQFGYSAGNTRDHAYGLYGAMSWNHETGTSYMGFWPSPSDVVSMSRRNLRSYLVSACLAGCPYDPHEPGIPEVSPIGSVTPPFTVDWSDASYADYYVLQRLDSYQVLLEDSGDSGPFDRVNWNMTTNGPHSGTYCYVSNGDGTITWQGSVTIPDAGGGRISFWSKQNIAPQSSQGAFSYSPDGGANWYWLQTFGRNDMTWRHNIHELDEFQGKTLLFRWETNVSSSSSKLYIDDIKINVWGANSIQADNISSSQYSVTGVADGERWFRVWAVDNEFGPGWPSEPQMAQISGSAVEDFTEGIEPSVSVLGLITPNPVTCSAVIPVSVSASAKNVSLKVFDLSGRAVADLTSLLEPGRQQNLVWSVENLPSGVHFVRLSTSEGVINQRVVLSGR